MHMQDQKIAIQSCAFSTEGIFSKTPPHPSGNSYISLNLLVLETHSTSMKFHSKLLGKLKEANLQQLHGLPCGDEGETQSQRSGDQISGNYGKD